MILLVALIIAQISPLSFVVNDNLKNYNIESNYDLFLIRDFNNDRVGKLLWEDFERNLQNRRDSSMVIILHNFDDLLTKKGKILLLNRLYHVNHKILTLILGNEIDLNVKKYYNENNVNKSIDKYINFIKEFHFLNDSLNTKIKLGLSFSSAIFKKNEYKQTASQILNELSNLNFNPISVIDLHNHWEWNKGLTLNKRIEDFKLMSNSLERKSERELIYLMTENSTWNNSPYKDSIFPIKYNFQTEEEQAIYLTNSSIIALSKGFKIIMFGVLKDRLLYKNKKKPGRFHNNGLFYNPVRVYDDSTLIGAKISAKVYKELNSIFDRTRFKETVSTIEYQKFLMSDNSFFIIVNRENEYKTASDLNFKEILIEVNSEINLINLINIIDQKSITILLDETNTFFNNKKRYLILNLKEITPYYFLVE